MEAQSAEEVQAMEDIRAVEEVRADEVVTLIVSFILICFNLIICCCCLFIQEEPYACAEGGAFCMNCSPPP